MDEQTQGEREARDEHEHAETAIGQPLRVFKLVPTPDGRAARSGPFAAVVTGVDRDPETGRVCGYFATVFHTDSTARVRLVRNPRPGEWSAE